MNLIKRQDCVRRPGAALICGAVASLALLALGGCGRQQARNGAMPPPEVGVVTIAPESVALTTELPGRIDPVRVAQVRARVDGIVLHRNFREGADVTNGEVLYEIDPAPYKAALDSANASLMQAQQLVERYKPLVDINAVSKQDYDNAVSAAAQAKAEAEAKAADEAAEAKKKADEEAQRQAELAAAIDFPSVQASLKEQIKDQSPPSGAQGATGTARLTAV